MTGRQIQIFISSPGDVSDERRRAAIVINRLAREFIRFFDLKVVLWEYEPMLASGHFQDAIVKPSETDIVVLILWSRLGTPLPDRYRGIDGRLPVTGTEWEYEDALAHHRSKGVPDLLVYRKNRPGHAEFDHEEELEVSRQQWQALRAFWERHFVDPEGGFKAAFNSFRDLDGFEELLEQHLRQLLRQRMPTVALRDYRGEITWTGGSPFRGLETYEAEHAALFFGREQAEQEIIEVLARNAECGLAFLLVLGASGAGKSSLVRAGVIPTLTVPGVVSGVSLWRRVLFSPGGANGDLFDRLASALIGQGFPELPGAGIDARVLAQQLRAAPAQAALPISVGLSATVKNARSSAGGKPRLVLLVDQLEELFSQVEIDAAEREGFVAVLVALAESAAVWVIATLRSDYYQRLDEVPGLRELTAQRQYDLPALRLAEMAEVIRGPANAAGISYETEEVSGLGLDAIIAEAAGRDPAVLPLLSFALNELYRRDIGERGGNALTLGTYRLFGGLDGAISERAEEVCAGLPDTALVAVLRDLVTVYGDQGEPSARPALLCEVASTPDREAVAEALIEARLVISAAGGAGPVVRLVHEALLRHWPRLVALIEAEREFLIGRARVQQERDRWEREGRASDLLLPAGKRLAEGADLLAARRNGLDPVTIEFIETSVTRNSAQMRRRLRRTQGVAGGFAVLALTAAAFGWKAADERDRAQRNFTAATQSISGINELIWNVNQGIQNVVGMRLDTIRRTLGQVRTTVEALAARAPKDPNLMSVRAAMFGNFVDAYLQAGAFKDALVASEEGVTVARAMVADYPGDARALRQMAIALYKRADVRKVAKDPQRVRDCEEAIATAQQLVRLMPADKDAMRILWVATEKLGETQLATNSYTAALSTLSRAATLARQRSDLDPADSEQRRDLSISIASRGDAKGAAGDSEDAFSDYLESLSIRRALAAENPGNVVFLRDVVIALIRIGNAHHALSIDRQASTGALVEALSLARSISQSDPANARAQRDVAVVFTAIGDNAVEIDKTAARDAYENAVKTLRALIAIDPDNSEAQWDLAAVLAKAALAFDDAAPYGQEALKTFQELEDAGRLTPNEEGEVAMLRQQLRSLP